MHTHTRITHTITQHGASMGAMQQVCGVEVYLSADTLERESPLCRSLVRTLCTVRMQCVAYHQTHRAQRVLRLLVSRARCSLHCRRSAAPPTRSTFPPHPSGACDCPLSPLERTYAPHSHTRHRSNGGEWRGFFIRRAATARSNSPVRDRSLSQNANRSRHRPHIIRTDQQDIPL